MQEVWAARLTLRGCEICVLLAAYTVAPDPVTVRQSPATTAGEVACQRPTRLTLYGAASRIALWTVEN